MTPADPPLPKSSPAPDRSPTLEWTTSREVALDCSGCGARFLLTYKYRFVDGLAATRVRCPAPGCGRGREYYMPVNAFDVAVAPAPENAPDPR